MVENASTVVTQSRNSCSLRERVYRVLEPARSGDWGSKLTDVILASLITISIAAVILESIPALERQYEEVFYWLEVFTICVFTVEYLLRVWSSVESSENLGVKTSFSARLRFVLTPLAIIDIVAILPFYLMFFGAFGGLDMRFLRSVRLLRILKLTRYSPAFDMLATCCKENLRSLSAAFFVLLTIMLLAASGMYFFERHAQPVAFGSIPAAMWWSFATLTTVGYGDVTPVTAGGKMFGAMITVIGVGMVALPTGILASGYAQQIRLRSDEYDAKAEEALDDGLLTDTEITDLEELRIDLNLGKHAASQILDTKMVQMAIRNEHARMTCPHCGGAIEGQ